MFWAHMTWAHMTWAHMTWAHMTWIYHLIMLTRGTKRVFFFIGGFV